MLRLTPVFFAIAFCACVGIPDRNANNSKAFLETNALRAEVSETSTGLQYEVVDKGLGCRPRPGSTVEVHYEMRRYSSERVLDSSYQRREPATYPLDQMIRGWAEGIPLMREGATWIFYVPPELAYGRKGSGSIPPNEALVFVVELLDAKTCRRDAV